MSAPSPQRIGPAAGFLALAVVQAILLVWGGTGVSTGSASRQLIAVLLACSLGAAAVFWVALDPRFRGWRWRWIFGLALLLRLVALQAAPLLEDDHYRYLWDGLRTATALDPYRLPPSAFFGDTTLAPVWQNVLSGINNPDVPTLYGPVLQALFAAAYLSAPADVGAIKLIVLFLDMAVLALLAWHGAGKAAVLILAIHPLVLKEAMASAHPDGIVALFLLLGSVAWMRRRPVWMGCLLALAICTKVAAAVALPLLLLRPQALQQGPGLVRRTGSGLWVFPALTGFGLTVFALYAPFLWRGGSELAGLSIFADQWRFNPLLYQLIEALTTTQTARPLTAVVLLALLAWITWQWRQTTALVANRTVAAQPPVDQALLLLLLLSPVVNPWYWLWALALSVHRGQAWLALAVSLAPLAYLNSSVLAEAGVWVSQWPPSPYAVLWPATALQALMFITAWYWRRCLELKQPLVPQGSREC